MRVQEGSEANELSERGHSERLRCLNGDSMIFIQGPLRDAWPSVSIPWV